MEVSGFYIRGSIFAAKLEEVWKPTHHFASCRA